MPEKQTLTLCHAVLSTLEQTAKIFKVPNCPQHELDDKILKVPQVSHFLSAAWMASAR